MFRRLRESKAQSIMEYALLIALIAAALVAGQTYFKRALAGRLKDTADSIGDQFTVHSDGEYSITTTQWGAREEKMGTRASNGKWSESTILTQDDTTLLSGYDADVSVGEGSKKVVEDFNSGDITNRNPFTDQEN